MLFRSSARCIFTYPLTLFLSTIYLYFMYVFSIYLFIYLRKKRESMSKRGIRRGRENLQQRSPMQGSISPPWEHDLCETKSWTQLYVFFNWLHHPGTLLYPLYYCPSGLIFYHYLSDFYMSGITQAIST